MNEDKIKEIEMRLNVARRVDRCDEALFRKFGKELIAAVRKERKATEMLVDRIDEITREYPGKEYWLKWVREKA